MIHVQNNSPTKSEDIHIIHRLNQALNLGTRRGKEWQIQVLESVNSLLDSDAIMSSDDLKFEATISDMVSALGWILEHSNAVTLCNAVETTVKLFTILPKLILKPHLLGLVSPLWSLILRRETEEVALSCAKALNTALSIEGFENEKAVWGVVSEKGIVIYTIRYLQSFTAGKENPDEYCLLMVLLLSTILRRWPQSRFTVWSDDNLMRKLNCSLVNLNFSAKVEVLKLLSAIALCENGATKVLENGESLLETVVECMGSSQPNSVRIEAFKFARILAINEERLVKMLKLCGEPLVKAIVLGMRKTDMSVALEACRLALITRWSGDHHVFFWRHGIGDALYKLQLEYCDDTSSFTEDFFENDYPLDYIISEYCRRKYPKNLFCSTNSNDLIMLRNYIWDILGWLSLHCKRGFNPKENGQENSFNQLVDSACYGFCNIAQIWSEIYQLYNADESQTRSVMRAVLMMIYSPCEYISSTVSVLYRHEGVSVVLRQVTRILNDISSRTRSDRWVIVYVLALAGHIGLPNSRSRFRQFSVFSVLRILLTVIRWCLSNIGNDSDCLSNGLTCCGVCSEEWEGEDMILFYSLWGLGEYIKDLEVETIKNDLRGVCVSDLVKTLEEICVKISAPGVRWLASYALSSLGYYGFPSKLNKRIENLLFSDTKLILKSGECLSAHGIVLAVRCPSLLRLGDQVYDSSEIRVRVWIDRQVLIRFLDFVYLGYLKSEKEQIRSLKELAEGCNVPYLSDLLSQERPIWGAPLPGCDFSRALGPLGFQFSDVIFEAKEYELASSECGFCSSLVPHMHVHKTILELSSCDYLRVLVNSGLKESHLPSIKLDLSWEAMVKLIKWLYTGKLPNHLSGCLWETSSVKEKQGEIKMYLELYRVSEFWYCEDLIIACSNEIKSFLDLDRQLCIELMDDFSISVHPLHDQ